MLSTYAVMRKSRALSMENDPHFNTNSTSSCQMDLNCPIDQPKFVTQMISVHRKE